MDNFDMIAATKAINTMLPSIVIFCMGLVLGCVIGEMLL